MFVCITSGLGLVKSARDHFSQKNHTLVRTKHLKALKNDGSLLVSMVL